MSLNFPSNILAVSVGCDDLDEHLARREEASSNLAGPSTTDAFPSVGTREQERPSLLHECIYTWIRHCQTQCMMGNLRATSRRKLDKEAFCVERPSASLIMFFSGFVYLFSPLFPETCLMIYTCT